MLLKKNIKVGNHNLNLLLYLSLILFFSVFESNSNENLEGQNINLKILDKISSKNELITISMNEEYIYKDLSIKSMKCNNSEFDDNPEIKAYLQVKDLTKNNKNNVFIFNGWMFSSSPSIAPFDHPVYDIWLISCY
ncbi:DUF2155 domain-containing protein [Candidatus Pelagibacter sp.]|nr:DUF2155 domain-containing protein [Candidatus Pelagibacter sp.]